MLSLYGEPDMDGIGIPIIKSVPKDLESMYVSRETTGDCYDAIIEDLENAVPLLTQTDKAKTCLEDCIFNSGKTLVSFGNYRMMFNGYDEYEYPSESFYEVGNTADPTGGNAYGSPNTGSTLSLYYPPFCIGPDGNRLAMSYGNQYIVGPCANTISLKVIFLMPQGMWQATTSISYACRIYI